MKFKLLVISALTALGTSNAFAALALDINGKAPNTDEIKCVRMVSDINCQSASDAIALGAYASTETSCGASVIFRMKEGSNASYYVRANKTVDSSSKARLLVAIPLNILTASLAGSYHAQKIEQKSEKQTLDLLHQNIDQLSSDLGKEGIVACEDFKDLSAKVTLSTYDIAH